MRVSKMSSSETVMILALLTLGSVLTLPVANFARAETADQPCTSGLACLSGFVASVQIGANPQGLTFDSANGDVYVANEGSNTVSVIAESSNKLIANVSVGNGPQGVVFDPSNGEIYVTDSGSSSGMLSVIDGSTNQVIATILLGTANPYGVAYDSTNGNLYVTQADSSIVSVVSGSTNSLITTVSVGGNPQGIIFDSSNRDIYVADYSSGTVSVISGSNNSVIATVTVGAQPYGLAFDSTIGDIYVGNGGTCSESGCSEHPGFVSVISGSSNKVIANVNAGDNPTSITFDSANQDVYVITSGENPIVSIIHTLTNTAIAQWDFGGNPRGIFFNPSNEEFYFIMTNPNMVVVVNAPSDPVVATVPVGSVYGDYLYTIFDPANGNIYVTNAHYASGVGYSGMVLVISGSTNTVIANVSVGKVPQAITVDTTNGDVYVADDVTGNLSVISGSTNAVVSTTPIGVGIFALACDSTNGDIYAANVNGTISVISGQTNEVIGKISVTDNRIQYLAFDSANGEVYAAVYGHYTGSVLAISGSTNDIVANITIGTYPAGIAFNSANGDVYVANSGYYEGTGLISVISGSTNTIIANISASAYPFGYITFNSIAVDPSSGNVYASGLPANGGQTAFVSRIDGSTNTIIATIPLGINPEGLVFDSSNGHIYLADAGYGGFPAKVIVISPSLISQTSTSLSNTKTVTQSSSTTAQILSPPHRPHLPSPRAHRLPAQLQAKHLAHLSLHLTCCS